MKRDYIYIVLIVILTGAGLFGSLHYNRENRQYKRHIKQLEKINARNAVSIDSLKASVLVRDKEDSLLVNQIKDLYITTTNAKPGTIINMPADSFLVLFTEYINSAGTAID